MSKGIRWKVRLINLILIVVVSSIVAYTTGSIMNEARVVVGARIVVESVFLFIALEFAYHFFIRPKS
jgi:hypothetical protein